MNIFDWYVHSYNTLHINWDTLTNISVILFARFVPILIGSLKCMCVCVCLLPSSSYSNGKLTSSFLFKGVFHNRTEAFNYHFHYKTNFLLIHSFFHSFFLHSFSNSSLTLIHLYLHISMYVPFLVNLLPKSILFHMGTFVCWMFECNSVWVK